MCALCNQELILPSKSISCGHIFCCKCITTWLTTNNCCPLKCGLIKSEGVHFISQIELEISDNVPIRCLYSSNGCQKILFRNSLERHIQECEYIVLSASRNADKGNSADLSKDMSRVSEFAVNNYVQPKCLHTLNNEDHNFVNKNIVKIDK